MFGFQHPLWALLVHQLSHVRIEIPFSLFCPRGTSRTLHLDSEVPEVICVLTSAISDDL